MGNGQTEHMVFESKITANRMRPSSRIALHFVAILACIGGQTACRQVPGTVEETTRKFCGQIGDLQGDGKIVSINSRCRGFARGPTDDGKYYAGFYLSPYSATNEFHLYFIFPLLPAGQVIVTNTESGVAEVWLFRNDNNYSNDVFVVKHNERQMLQRGGQKMTGKVGIKWGSDADFVIGVDATLTNDSSTWAYGEFVGSLNTKLDPLLWEWPAILIKRESK
jgi:hypothetical protein